MQKARKSYKDAMLEVRDSYRASGEAWPATTRTIAQWAIAEGLWEPQPELAISKCSADLGKVIKEEHHMDKEGRFVKTNIAAKLEFTNEDGEEKQGWFWDDVRTASELHLVNAFDQQRHGVKKDIDAIRVQLASANDNNPNIRDNPIELDWNFDDDD